MFFFTLLILVGAATAAPAAEPKVVPDKLIQLAHAIDNFGQALLQRLEQDEVNARRTNPKNVLISPLSVSSVLSTLLAGAANETHKQLYETLGYSNEHLTEKEILSNFADLRQDLNRQLKDTQNLLEVADAVAIQQGYPILESFQEALYGELLMTKNFRSESHKATLNINDWVSQHTKSKIPKLFDKDLDPETVIVLLNAVYFKGLWKKPFETKNTKKADFFFPSPNGKEAELVDMMNAHGHFSFAHFDDGDMLEVPYLNDSFSMLFFLPKQGAITEQTTISSLFNSPTTRISARAAKLHSATVNVHIPKFKIEASYSLNDPLTKLGITDVFAEGKADLSRINGKRDLIVSNVAHKAFIEVNEEGAEAAAATGVVIVPTSVQIPVEFNANRPFLFTIYDKQYQLALFSGVINKP